MHHHTLKLNLTVCFLLEVLIAFSAVKASAGNLPSKAPNPEDFFLGNNETQSNTLQLENTTAAVKSQIRQVHETKIGNEGYSLNPDFGFKLYPPDASNSYELVGSQKNRELDKTLILSQLPSPTAPIPPAPPPKPIPTPQPSPTPPLEETPSPPPESPQRPEIPGTITIKRFEFEGNTAFSDEQLSKETAEFLNRPITFAELLQVENNITNLYIKEGYINSGAVIPAEQTLSPEGAVVKVRIVEGGVEDIRVTGTRRLKPGYVRSRIALATSKPLNREKLLEALQLLQLDPLIANISAELSTGSRPDQSLLEVRVVEADSFRVDIFVDNAGDPSVGTFRRGVNLSEGNLLGFGDRFSFEFINSEGSNAFDVGYTFPINPRNGTIGFATGRTAVGVVEPPFDRIDITGDYYYFDLNLRQPIIQNPSQELALGLTFSRQQSESRLLGERFPLSAGADEEGRTRLSTVRFFQEYTQRNSQQVFALRSQFSLGVGWLGATVNSDPPDSRYLAWRGQGQYVRLLAPDTLLVLRSEMQLASKPLVPIEQIRLGGLQTVKGYRQDEFLTDNGVFASAEVRFPVLRARQIQGLLQVVPFINFGVGWNNSENSTSTPDPNTLIGTGLGLQWQMGDTLSARIDYAFPLIDVDDRDRTLQEQGLYFSINYSPF
ncbi:ShlB/FhaC/HecB family hemolysin secretion/activation protein [Fischerella thermalis]|uniref:ShlB/FhaC/HecB family hemolysin secretion/activation protein n=1 Tax=Fischerella thermalis TaxID=372787 RepID=UPI000C7FB048|nr:ShlB/FhaC/HecB family hemolysin secretion/activation protein [Fischerella thermalis]PLZ08176.1 hemolysin activation/secretion protein [Fischerella thermalis WC1110]PLZ26144.1 hemolysin activation/secretion protein [Fischerella thermalis WC341]PLZ44826.1 hemolysin activation/secretion protein [Fischerella thermalis WC538]PLZ46441.1 hemolysin activation/secretion protein [Fischerella thermalis WC527]PLZ56581.1 hemolysin activation/secretion protein [Fischerella thermalis WC442]